MRAQSVRWRIARRHLNQRGPKRLRWVLAFVVLMLLLTTSAAGAAGLYFVSHLPSASKFHIRFSFQDARIYDARGDLLYNMADLSKNGGRRVVEPLQGMHDSGNACRGGVNRIPLVLQNATIATEDATFYKNPGFDPLSIVRAAYQDLTYGHIVSGASTITQQVVRATMLSDARTFSRKADEVALSYEITKRYSKRKILWYYLNSVYYGNLAYGAQAAARIYFHEPVCKLDQAQAALLAGLPRGPTVYDPVTRPSSALVRLREVLGFMRIHGYLHSRRQVKAMLAEASHWSFRAPSPIMRYPQFVRYAINQLQSMPAFQHELYQGIDVYTTLNPRLQNLAQRTVTNQINTLGAQHVTDGALVSLDLRPGHYGWIDAMVGSAKKHGKASQINMAVTPRQPGSSMKPFNYIWAFTHGHVGPGTTVSDEPIQLPDPGDPEDGGWYAPTNYDHQWHGTVTLREALANSLNVPAVKVEFYITGPNHVAGTAYRFGMKHLYADNPKLGCDVCYAVTLGGLTRGTRLVEETSAYGVFASGGRTVPPIAIWKVVKRSTGKVLYCASMCPRGVHATEKLVPHPHRVLDTGHAYEMTNVLSDNNARCSVQVCEFGLTSPLLLSRPAAAKTGTTNAWTDNWTVGYVPQMVTGVWVGNADRSPMINVIGITGAAPIWHDYMEGAFKILRLPVKPFVAPPTVTTTGQCSVYGTSNYMVGQPDIFVQPATTAGRPLQPTAYPYCSIPERGQMPITCLRYGPPEYLSAQYPAVAPCLQFSINPPFSGILLTHPKGVPGVSPFATPYTYFGPTTTYPQAPVPAPAAPVAPAVAPTAATQALPRNVQPAPPERLPYQAPTAAPANPPQVNPQPAATSAPPAPAAPAATAPPAAVANPPPVALPTVAAPVAPPVANPTSP